MEAFTVNARVCQSLSLCEGDSRSLSLCERESVCLVAGCTIAALSAARPEFDCLFVRLKDRTIERFPSVCSCVFFSVCVCVCCVWPEQPLSV